MDKKTVIQKLVELFSEAKKEDFAEFPLAEDGAIVVDGEDLAVGMAVTLAGTDGEPAPDGDHLLADGRVVVVEGGTIAEVKDADEASPESEPAPEEMSTHEMARKAEMIKDLLGGLGEGDPLNEDVKKEVMGILDEIIAMDDVAVDAEKDKEEMSEDKKEDENTEEKFHDFKTTDNKILRVNSNTIDKGEDIYEILEDGTTAAINDGVYVLQNGEQVDVVGGKVKELIPVDNKDEEKTEEPEAKAEGEEKTEEDNEPSFEERVLGAIESLTEKVNSMETEAVAMKSQLKDLGAEPSEEPEDLKKKEFSSNRKKHASKAEEIRDFLSKK